MENLTFFFPVFFLSLLISITIYSIYIGFGPPAKKLRDPFEEHEDYFYVIIIFFLWQLLKDLIQTNKIMYRAV
jgi:PsbN protein